MKSDSIFGLNKIPDSVLLKEANIEIGKLKSYIDELEEKLQIRTAAIKSGSIEALMLANEVLKKKNKELNNLLYKK